MAFQLSHVFLKSFSYAFRPFQQVYMCIRLFRGNRIRL